MQASTTVRSELRADIASCGYFPDLVEDAVLLAAGDEPIHDFVVHHEPTFAHEEIHRHLTVLLLTPTRLIVGHTDDHPPEPGTTGTFAATSTESVALRRIQSVVVTRVLAEPERFDATAPQLPEVWATISWGAMRRLDLEPASCTDPQCDADHGYTGSLVGDDLTVRMSAAADGTARVDRLVRFATALQRVSGQ